LFLISIVISFLLLILTIVSFLEECKSK
jgi:hypothetical protein